MKTKKGMCYDRIFNRLGHISERLSNIRTQINEFKASVENGKSPSEEDEVCVDELESEAALLEMVLRESISMIGEETEPKGDA